MANFVITLPKLTGCTNYPFWKIHVKLALTLIIHSDIIFTTEDMLNTLVLSQCQEYSMKCIYSTSQISKLSLTLHTFNITSSVTNLFLILKLLI